MAPCSFTSHHHHHHPDALCKCDVFFRHPGQDSIDYLVEHLIDTIDLHDLDFLACLFAIFSLLGLLCLTYLSEKKIWDTSTWKHNRDPNQGNFLSSKHLISGGCSEKHGWQKGGNETEKEK
ncbi:MAG: hypothetical protein MMC33_003929 [Icmadophila ericetorum]|nr:hypothetical protein [Icmadophila ericetorum]